MKKKRSHLEIYFENILIKNKIKYKTEFKFCETRKWRADFLIGKDLLVEIEGGAWTGGRHTRGYGFVNDCEKYNNATLLGYKILRYTSTKDMSNFLNDLSKLKTKLNKNKMKGNKQWD